MASSKKMPEYEQLRWLADLKEKKAKEKVNSPLGRS
jgi:hypothetical protein